MLFEGRNMNSFLIQTGCLVFVRPSHNNNELRQRSVVLQLSTIEGEVTFHFNAQKGVWQDSSGTKGKRFDP